MPFKMAQFQVFFFYINTDQLSYNCQVSMSQTLMVHVPNVSFFCLFIGGLDMKYVLLFFPPIMLLQVCLLAYIILTRVVQAREILKTLKRKVCYWKVQQQIFICIPYVQAIVLALRYVRDCFTGLNSSPSSYPQLCHVISQCLDPWIKCSSPLLGFRFDLVTYFDQCSVSKYHTSRSLRSVYSVGLLLYLCHLHEKHKHQVPHWSIPSKSGYIFTQCF